MGHIIEGSARNSPQTVPVEEANRKGKAVTEGNKLQDYLCQRRERIRGKIVLINEIVCFSLPERH